MELAVQWAQLIGTGALVATLVTVIIYTIKTSSMAKATKAMADVENRNIELRERPIVKFVVMEKVQVTMVDNMAEQLITKNMHPIDFPTHIENAGRVHAKARVKATVMHKGARLKLPKESLYLGARILEMQAGTGINGHLDLCNLFKENGVELKTEEETKTSPICYNDRELIVRLESKVINFYKPNNDFDTTLSKNPPAYYRWKGNFAIDAYGSWIPEYDVDDFDSIPEMS